MGLIFTIMIGLIGAFIAMKLKVPAGAIIGSLISVVAFNIITGKAIFPQEFKVMTQIGTGAYIGSRICKKDVMELKKIVIPAIILTVSMGLFNITVSLFLSSTTDIDLVTALFATAPAGITDMTLISVDFGADSSKVAAIQLVRLISVIAIMPSLIKYFITKTNRNEKGNSCSEEGDKNPDKDWESIIKRTTYTLIIGFIFGYMGYFLGVPAGAISFSMIGCAYYNIKTSKAYMPLNLRRGVQVFGGCLIGARITM